MMVLSRLSAVLIAGFFTILAKADEPTSLQAKFGAKFVVGVSLGGMVPGSYSKAEQALIETQFGAVTPESCMKMPQLQPREGEFHFEEADALVAFALKHKLQINGHTLVWAKDERTPEWVFRDGDKPASRELVLKRLKTHIDTVVGRYKGKIASWDVVNEAIDDSEPYLRPSKWEKTLGVEFVAKAFEYAHAADPNAKLIYNDYNVELASKRVKLVHLLDDLRKRNVPIDAVGIQGHWEVDKIPFKEIEAFFALMDERKLKTIISELDLGVVPRGVWYADGGKNREEIAKTDPLAAGCPSDLLVRQGEEYAELFRLFQRQSGSITRVTFWNLHDGRSWLNTFPWNHAEYPLLFDRHGAPKPAFDAVMKVE